MNDPKAEQLIQQFFTKKPTRFTNTTKSVTIMKYLGPDNSYYFRVLDRFDIEDEAGRAVCNHQFLKDFYEACMMNNIDYFVVAIKNIYRNSNDFEKSLRFLPCSLLEQ